MTIAFDASGFHNGSWGLGSPLSQNTHSHTPVGTPRAAIVYICTQELTDTISSVKYGGVTMTEISGSPFFQSAGAEHAGLRIFFLGSGIPTGARAVNVTSNAATTFGIASVTLTAAGDTFVVASASAEAASGTAISVSIPIPAGATTVSWTGTSDEWGVLGCAVAEASDTSGVTSFRSGVMFSGVALASNTSPGAGITDIVNLAGVPTTGQWAAGYGAAVVVGVEPEPEPYPDPTPGGQETGLHIGVTDVIGWEIDGLPVRMVGDWQADVTTGWGDRTFTGAIDRDVGWAHQGSSVTGWKRSGEPLWQGTLVTDPRPDGDLLRIRAEGDASRLAANPARLLYRSDGGSEWTDAEGDPNNYTNSEKYDTDEKPGALIWRLGDGTTAYGVGNQSSFAVWKEGGLITRYGFTAETSVNFANFDLQTHQATGPSGSRTLEGTHSLAIGAATPVDYARTLTTPADLITVRMICTGATTPAAKQRVKLTAIHVYGRTTDDDFSASDVVADVAALSGFGTDGVSGNGLAVLPLDWTDPHPGLLDYMAELCDWRWMARGDEMTFGPYGKVWESATGIGATPNLEPEPRANRFRQPYRARSGALRTVTASPEDDPFPGQEVVVSGEVLEDPQPNAALATAVATAAIEYEASLRASGSVELTEVRWQGGVWSPYDVSAGDQLLLTDLAPDLGAQRIEAMTYRPGGRATATVGAPFDLVRSLAHASRPPRVRAASWKRLVRGGR